jgi:hypothetical protein
VGPQYDDDQCICGADSEDDCICGAIDDAPSSATEPATSQVFYCHCYTCGSKTPAAKARNPNAKEDWLSFACDKCHGDDGTVWAQSKCKECGTGIYEWQRPEDWDLCAWCANN